MSEHRITGEGRQVVVRAQQQARRLGHGFIGCEHLLYGLAGAEGEVGAFLRMRGVTPERYEAQFVHLVGQGRHAVPGAGFDRFDPFDRDALTAIGIDLDVVRERVEARFGPGALTFAVPGPLRRRQARHQRRGDRVTGHLPITRKAKMCLDRSLHHAGAMQGGDLDAEHIAVALFTMDQTLPSRILSAMGAWAPDLRAEILERYRAAGQYGSDGS